MTSEPDPQWLSQAWRGFVDEWTHYARTVLAVTLRPRRFMRAWADGEAHALNPLVCMINAIAILTGAKLLARLALHRSDDLPEWLELIDPALNLVLLAVIASLVHFPLRLLGGRRPWRTTLATTMFVASGPMMPLYLVRDALFPTFEAMQNPRFYLMAIPMFTVLLVYQVLTLASAHRVAWWRPLTAFMLGVGFFVVLGGLVEHSKSLQRSHHAAVDGVERRRAGAIATGGERELARQSRLAEM